MSGQTTETQWYIARDGKQHGPLTDIEMRTFVAHNYLRVTDLIWKPGMTEWTLAPAVFPAVFPDPSATAVAEPMGVAPFESEPAEDTSFEPSPTQYDRYAEAEPADAYEPRSSTHVRPAPAEPPRRGGIMRRVAVAATAISVTGAVAYGAMSYRDPLMQMLGGNATRSTASSEFNSVDVPTVQADVTAPTTPTTASVEAPSTPPPTVAADAATLPPADTAPVVSVPTTPNLTPSAETVAAAVAVPPTPSANSTTVDAAAAPAAETQVAALEPPPPVAPPPAAITGPSIDERLQKISAWTLLKKNYPDWYRDQVASADKLVSEQKPAGDVSMQLAQALVALRRQNADKALAASPDRLRKIASAFLDNLKSLRSQSVSACYGFISKGEASPAVAQIVDSTDADSAFHAQVAAIFEAVAEGSVAPTKHEAAVKTDYDLLIKELGKLGWKEEDLQTFSNPRLLAKREPERVCKMVQDWFVAHLAVADKGARDRLLYETLKPVVSG